MQHLGKPTKIGILSGHGKNYKLRLEDREITEMMAGRNITEIAEVLDGNHHIEGGDRTARIGVKINEYCTNRSKTLNYCNVLRMMA